MLFSVGVSITLLSSLDSGLADNTMCDVNPTTLSVISRLNPSIMVMDANITATDSAIAAVATLTPGLDLRPSPPKASRLPRYNG